MAEQSRNEEILRSIIDETEYNKTPQSREEELLLELKQAIEGGGSSVVPNPEGEATETLNKLGIDDTVYGIPKELPAVTSADAGNVLGVNSEGQWTKMAASGGSPEIIELVNNGNVTAYTLPNGMTNAQLYDMISNSPSKYIIKAYIDPKTGYLDDRNNAYMYLSFDEGNKHAFTGLFHGHATGNWYICTAYIAKNQDNSDVYVGKKQLTVT